MNWVQKINCYGFKIVSPHKSSYGTVCTVCNFYTLPATARSHPTDHHGPSTISENIKRDNYSYKIQELDVYRANEAEIFEEMCSYQLCQVQKWKGPSKRALLKKRILVCIGLSIGIKADTYEEIEAPVRAGISLESMTNMFSKEFLRFRKEDLRRLFNLLKFPSKSCAW